MARRFGVRGASRSGWPYLRVLFGRAFFALGIKGGGKRPMRTVGAAMASSLGILLSLCTAAFAFCDLTGFDRTQPAAIRGSVNNQFANFEWASDVDLIDGRLWVWHYILNRRPDLPIGGHWDKAGIIMPLANPLPPGKAACNQFLADSIQTNPDTDAPIIYGTNEQQQRAAVYVANKPPKAADTSSKIRSSYVGEGGGVIDLSIDLSTVQTSNGFQIVLDHSPGLVVGIADISKALSSDQLERLAIMAKEQGAFVARATYSQFTKQSPDAALNLFPKENRPKEDTEFLFFAGRSLTKFELKAEAVQKVSANMIVFDEKIGRPVFATDVSVLVPAR
jgi:hypothetical protein